MRIAAVKPVFHSLLTTYWHLPPPTAMLLEEELEELLLILEDKLEELLFSDELDEIPTELDELLMLDEELAIELIAWLLAELLIGVLLDELAPTIP
jgi:hypothetical protein